MGQITIYRGHVVKFQDLIIRQHILNLMCQFELVETKVLLTLTEILE
jgi:oxygen-independent coproporphyrinogen-3 oxidase